MTSFQAILKTRFLLVVLSFYLLAFIDSLLFVVLFVLLWLTGCPLLVLLCALVAYSVGFLSSPCYVKDCVCTLGSQLCCKCNFKRLRRIYATSFENILMAHHLTNVQVLKIAWNLWKILQNMYWPVTVLIQIFDRWRKEQTFFNFASCIIYVPLPLLFSQ